MNSIFKSINDSYAYIGTVKILKIHRKNLARHINKHPLKLRTKHTILYQAALIF